MTTARILLFSITATLVAMLMAGVCHGCHFEVPPSSASAPATTSSSYDDGDDRLFVQFRLDIIKEKMLRGLGMMEPPRILESSSRIGQNSLKRIDLRMNGRFAAGQQRRIRTPGATVNGQRATNGGSKTSTVIVFADLPPSKACWTPTNSTEIVEWTQLTFKLPSVPSTIQNAVLWYKSSIDPKVVAHKKSLNSIVLLCPCDSVAADGDAWTTSTATTTTSSSPRPPTKHGVGGCSRYVATVSKMSFGDPSSRRGWSYVNLPKSNALVSAVNASLSDGRQRSVSFHVSGANVINDRKRPFLVLEFDNGTSANKRTRRSGDDDDDDDDNDPDVLQRECPTTMATSRFRLGRQPLCCRAGFWVDFSQLGWNDWIISPTGFHYYYCNGRCDSRLDSFTPDIGAVSSTVSSSSSSPTDYSQVMNVYMKRFQKNFRPCCVPRSMSHLPVVITTDGITLNRTFIPNFIVKECACLGVA